jgi:hypothetical protein
MRFVLRAMCVVALAGCSDGKGPVEPKHASLLPTIPVDKPPAAGQPRSQIDPRSTTERLEALFGARLSKVSIPVDEFSLSGDAVHPDIACSPDTWNGARCWLMYTPYKNSNPTFENPSFVLATDDTTWTTPPQITNPLIPYPGASGYNSDPDHAFDPATHRMVQVYRVVADSFNKIMMMSTGNARTWTTPVVAFVEKNHDAVSPTLVIEANRTARLWYVRAGAKGCDAASSSVQTRSAKPDADSRYEHSSWSAAATADLAIPGFVIWHLDVIELPDDRGYVAMIAAYPRGWSCSSSDIWLASSADGVQWQTYAVPVMWRSMKAARDRNISTWYRGTIHYDRNTDMLDLWPSALSKTTWSVYHVSANLSTTLGLLRAAQPSDRAAMMSQTVKPVSMPMP